MFKLVVLSCILAVTSAGAITPLGWTGAGWGGLAAPSTGPLAAPLAATWAAPVAVGGPVIAGAHILHKRSAVLTSAPFGWSTGLGIPGALATPLSATPLIGNAWASSLGVATPAIAGAHILHKRSAVLAPASVSWSAGLALPGALATPLTAAPLIGAPWGRAAVWGARW